ncbi:MAG: UDP-N-acetylmuramate dehydrogenase [Clostridium sp.]|jgi:UDP-N-acetylmuramate dehydrogenase|nr:UDP-N-acetylmuramate dehydrogenase [Clostridium sp.]
MISGTVTEILKGFVPEKNILFQEPLGKHTTFRIGGSADCFIEIESKEQLKRLQRYFYQLEIPFFVLGNGSNLLVGDRGFRGVVLHIGNAMGAVTVRGRRVTAQAGALLSRVAKEACEHGLTGFEFAAGIPGTIGGGIVMNAGAYGGECGRAVALVEVLDQEGNTLELDHPSMEFGYRTSSIKNQPFIVTQVTLELEHADPAGIRSRMEELAAKRRQKQPLEYPSAGSVFKRPEGHYAGELIMNAGLRGFQTGGARVSDKHCGFIINTGNATAADVVDVIREVQERVKEKFYVELETEILLLGDF